MPFFILWLGILDFLKKKVYIEVLNTFVKGTAFCVYADNLGAHSLAGFQDAFDVEKFYTFCCISRDQMQMLSQETFH